MDKQFTASEVRANAAFRRKTEPELSAMLRAYADRLEADERAVPVAIVKDSDALYTGHLSWTGESVPPETNLYTHPSPADAERLTEALQEIHDTVASGPYPKTPEEKLALEKAQAALAAHSAQAQKGVE